MNLIGPGGNHSAHSPVHPPARSPARSPVRPPVRPLARRRRWLLARAGSARLGAPRPPAMAIASIDRASNDFACWKRSFAIRGGLGYNAGLIARSLP